MIEAVREFKWSEQDNVPTDTADQFAYAVSNQAAQGTAPESQNWFFSNHSTKKLARRTITNTYAELSQTERILRYYSKPSEQANLPKGTDWTLTFQLVRDLNAHSERKIQKFNTLPSRGLSRKEYSKKLLSTAISARTKASLARDYLLPLANRPAPRPPTHGTDFLG